MVSPTFSSEKTCCTYQRGEHEPVVKSSVLLSQSHPKPHKNQADCDRRENACSDQNMLRLCRRVVVVRYRPFRPLIQRRLQFTAHHACVMSGVEESISPCS